MLEEEEIAGTEGTETPDGAQVPDRYGGLSPAAHPTVIPWQNMSETIAGGKERSGRESLPPLAIFPCPDIKVTPSSPLIPHPRTNDFNILQFKSKLFI